MEGKRYKPRFDKLYYLITGFTAAFTLLLLLIPLLEPSAGGWIVMGGTALFVAFFLISPLFGYVELREKTLFIRFGFFLRREIPYERVRGLEKKRGVIADSMVSLKNAMEHLNVKYNAFDCVSISVKNEDDLISEPKARCGIH